MAAGTLSTLGFIFGNPFLDKYLRINDVCGINNLHGMPGILGGIAGASAAQRHRDCVHITAVEARSTPTTQAPSPRR